MTLRDYFAATALGVAERAIRAAVFAKAVAPEEAPKYIAIAAYEIADAMLAAREAKP